MVMKALDILEYLHRTRSSLKIDEISMKTSTTRTSTYRIVRTLVIRGYLVESIDGRYSFKSKGSSLGSIYLSKDDFSSQLRSEEEALITVFDLLQKTLQAIRAKRPQVVTHQP
jgi:DNA-binding IclR family transcriptional regulator